jgi:Brp/Blh family beta-carotene 15,15'-monooxygenase
VNRDWKWPLGALALLVVLYGAGRFSLPDGWWVFPWLLSLVFVGLPHGALDHEVVLRLWRPQPPPRWALCLAGLVMAAWFAAPLAVFIGFILLTCVHWGLGDLWWSWQRDPAYFTSPSHKTLFALWRGSLPMFIPLVVAPQVYGQVAESVCQPFSHSHLNFDWMNAMGFRAIVMVCVLVSGCFEGLLANRKSATYLLNASEGGLLLAVFVLLPPLLAIGCYFVFWHGLRHVLRLMQTENLSFSQFGWRSAPATLGALVLLGFLAAAVLHQGAHPHFLGAYLAVIATLTVPHSLVVIWMDRQQKAY